MASAAKWLTGPKASQIKPGGLRVVGVLVMGSEDEAGAQRLMLGPPLPAP